MTNADASFTLNGLGDPRDLEDAREQLLSIDEHDRQQRMRAAWLASWTREQFESAKEWEGWITGECRIARRQAFKYAGCGSAIRSEVRRSALVQHAALSDMDKVEILSKLPDELLVGFLAEHDVNELNRNELRDALVFWWAQQPGCPAKVRRQAAGLSRRKRKASKSLSCAAGDVVMKLSRYTETRLVRAAMEVPPASAMQALRNSFAVLAWQVDNGIVDEATVLDMAAELGGYAEAVKAAAESMRYENEPVQEDQTAEGSGTVPGADESTSTAPIPPGDAAY